MVKYSTRTPRDETPRQLRAFRISETANRSLSRMAAAGGVSRAKLIEHLILMAGEVEAEELWDNVRRNEVSRNC